MESRQQEPDWAHRFKKENVVSPRRSVQNTSEPQQDWASVMVKNMPKPALRLGQFPVCSTLGSNCII